MKKEQVKCWICGEVGKVMSGEHKIKGADLKRSYGKDLKKVDELAFYSGDNSPVNINKVNDSILKFPKVICKECNDTRTQKHDKAYDTFVAYTNSQSTMILESGTIDYKVVFGSDWKFKKKCLFKYFAKHAGCKVVTSDLPHSIDDLSSFIINDSRPLTFTLKMEFSRNIDDLSRFNNEKSIYRHLYNSETMYAAFSDARYSFSGFLCNGIMIFHWFVAPLISPMNEIGFDDQIEKIQVSYKEIPANAKADMHRYINWVHRRCHSDLDIRNWIATNT